MSQIASEYGISVAQLSQLCKDEDIPCPPKSYFHRSADRRLEVTRPGLPVSKSPARAIVSVGDSPKPRARKAKSRLSPEQRHNQLLDVARGIIEQDGLAACTIGQVAKQADVSDALAFRYCRSRRDMLTDLTKREWAQQAKAWMKQARKCDTQAEKLEVFGHAYLAHVDEQGTVLRHLLEIPDVAAQVETLINEQINNLADSDTKSGIAAAKTRALIAAHHRSGDLLAAGKGKLDQCARTALAFSAPIAKRW